MNKTLRLFALPLVFGLAACATAPDGSEQAAADSPVDTTVHVHAKRAHASDGDGELAPARDGVHELTNEGTTDPSTIAYHGGKVMHNGVHVYLIWYGNWSGNSATTILTNLVSNIGGSSYFGMNTMYTDGTGSVQSSVTYEGAIYDSYSQGSSLGSSGVWDIVDNALSSGALPKDGAGIYFVLTSPDVTESQGTNNGFCSAYCGWHSSTWYGGTNDIKYAFVGDPSSQCASSCEAQSTSPNGNAGADGMASVLAHELAEAATDPFGDGWWDSYNGSDYETGDKCAWSFGTTYKSSSGAYYNTTLGGSNYLLQMLWVNKFGGYCANEYNAASTLAPNTTLSENESVWSADGRFELIMQSDGNLVLYEGSSALWASKTEGKGGTHASMQSDGNLVIYTDSGSAVWASNTNGKSGAGLVVQNDGNVVIYYDGSPVWASGTCCH